MLQFYKYLRSYLDEDHYDMVNEQIDGDNNENVYGDVNDDLEFKVVQNPYYGGDVNINTNHENTHGAMSSMTHMEVITSTSNTYYEM